MRRVLILALLLGATQLILPLGVRGYGAQTLFVFGFLVLAAHTAGELATSLHLPRIVGYLAAGIAFGPEGLGTVTSNSIDALEPVSALAIALIAFLAGAELRWQEVRARGRAIAKILLCELSLSFVAIALLLILLRKFIPFLQDGPWPQVIAFSVLFASIGVVHSPAVTMALLTETKAGGPVARTTLGVVLISDVVVVVLFSGALALARAIVPPSGAEAAGVGVNAVVWEIGGAIIVGAALGGLVALYLRFVRRELFLFAILVTFFGSEIAAATHVETLLMLLTAGFVTENVSRDEHGEAIRHAMERSAAPVFVVFFALAGAQIALGDIASVWFLVLPLVGVRLLAIWGGTTVGAKWGNTGDAGKLVWLGLISQAGVAIGLSAAAAQAYTSRGGQIQALFLAVLALNQIIGPILFRYALVRGGEISPVSGPEPGAHSTPPHAEQAVVTGGPSARTI
jgi:Kef-type K+ transport system membrane component KefB